MRGTENNRKGRRRRTGAVSLCLLLSMAMPCALAQIPATIPAIATRPQAGLSPTPAVLDKANPATGSPAVLPAIVPTAQEALIKDVSSVQGIRDNQLIGYGIVVGLQNTGDSQMTYFPLQTLLSTLQRLGIVVPYPLTTIMVKNMAGVFVEATLPPFAQPGSKIDVTVSSTGDARSLTGGMLLMAPLYGPDGQIYAEAQGPLVVGGY
ncbi:MAG: flagellar basal body P-ring protein FlgI, partial [Acidobacteriaceae bacterium]